jgi:hypothetical protein
MAQKVIVIGFIGLLILLGNASNEFDEFLDYYDYKKNVVPVLLNIGQSDEEWTNFEGTFNQAQTNMTCPTNFQSICMFENVKKYYGCVAGLGPYFHSEKTVMLKVPEGTKIFQA